MYRTKDGELVLTLTRSDGTTTWSKIPPGLEYHDLAHYAVESVLHLKNSFYGMIETGVEISDFEDKDKTPELLPEALVTEHLVNLLQTEVMNQGSKLDLITMLSEILEENELPFPDSLNDESLGNIRRVFAAHCAEVSSIRPGEKMVCSIEL